MLQILTDLPSHVVGIEASGRIDKGDFEKVLIPAIDSLAKRTGKINYLLLLNTDIRHFSTGAWWEDMLVGLKHFTKWRRIAIVTASRSIHKFSDFFSVLVPGESRGFSIHELEAAKQWVSAEQE